MHEREKSHRPQRDRLAARVRPGHDERGVLAAESEVDRHDLSGQARNTIQQAANAYKTTGSARVTATGHADRSGPENYNMALSLRRANTVKNALVGNGVPATAISVIGMGESQPLVPTADGVREPQNRRVEIVLR